MAMTMHNVSKVQLVDLAAFYPDKIDLFICCVSFEARCLSIATSLNSNTVSTTLICSNQPDKEIGKSFRAHRESLKKKFRASLVKDVPLYMDNPLRTADSFVTHLSAINIDQINTCLVDITTFTHEALLILLKVLTIKFGGSPCKIHFAYTAAKEYSVNEPESEKWLARGIGHIRSVLGYAGELNPSKSTHLIIMMGFDWERSKKLIDIFEPARVSLGVGRKITSVNSKHFKINMLNFKNLSFRREDVIPFQFSCTNPDQTKLDLQRHVEKYPDYNVIIATQNTKLSTIGAGLFVMEYPHVQLCLATVNQYNIAGYSLPDEFCYVYEAKL